MPELNIHTMIQHTIILGYHYIDTALRFHLLNNRHRGFLFVHNLCAQHARETGMHAPVHSMHLRILAFKNTRSHTNAYNIKPHRPTNDTREIMRREVRHCDEARRGGRGILFSVQIQARV